MHRSAEEEEKREQSPSRLVTGDPISRHAYLLITLSEISEGRLVRAKCAKLVARDIAPTPYLISRF
jgi:hypothetical protein